MTEPPETWERSTLGELGRYLNGRGFKKSEWSTKGRPIIRIQNLTGSGTGYNYFAGEAEDRYIARPGDLLVSWAATLGAFVWTGPEAVVNQHIFKVESNIDVKLHKYLLDFKLDELMRHTHGSGMVHITRGRFDSLPVAVPPIDEQRRIVEILEDHLSRLDAADAYLTTCGVRARSWHAALVNAAIWPGTSSERPLSSLLREPMRNGHSARASADGRGIRTLTLRAVTRGQFTDEFTKLTVADPQKAAGLWLKSGDILVQRANTAELVGTTRRYDGPDDWAIFPDLLIRVRVDESQVDPHYVAAVMQSEAAHRWLRARAKGLAGSMPKIDQSTIGALPIPTPVLEDQRQVASRVADLSQETQRLSKELRRAQAQGVALRRALLHAAFTGRLTGHASDPSRVEELAASSSALGSLG